MKVAFLSLWILLGTIPAFADRGGIPNGGVGDGVGNGNQVHGAPAPLLGLGIPTARTRILLGRPFTPSTRASWRLAVSSLVPS